QNAKLRLAFALAAISFQHLGGIILYHCFMINNTPKRLEEIRKAPFPHLYRGIGKRVFDISLTLLALPFALPIVGMLAFLVALSGGKPFYRQNRIGKNGRIYRMWKLRSM